MSPYLLIFAYTVPICMALGFIIAFFTEEEWKSRVGGMVIGLVGGSILAVLLCAAFEGPINKSYRSADINKNYPDIVVSDVTYDTVTFVLDDVTCKTKWKYDVGSTKTVLYQENMECEYGEKVPVLTRHK